MMKILLRAVVTVALLAVAGGAVWYSMLGGLDKAAAAVEVGKEMPDFALKDPEGTEHKLSDYRGKVVVLAFSSQHCPYSRGADPAINDLAKKFADQGVVLLSIDSHADTTPEEIHEYRKEAKLSFPILKDVDNAYADAVGAKRTPEMFVIDKEGNLAYHGAFDNRRGPDSEADEHYTADAVNAVVAGNRPEITE
ncbi:MAG: redoxin domain-containing protein, partial [Candidatus Hydrogenedentes bacterium]|nr:redoxin domain-containing protein [Candidatus Hydrogenedentota bacterium]